MNIVRHIPNTITSLNLVCGAAGVVCTFSGRFDLAFYFMLGGAVFDFFDGFAARALRVTSPIGKELDSLSDLITFGLLPSMMLYRLMVEYGVPGYWCYIPLIMAVFSALRLAKFNIDDRQATSFLGLATPAAALLCGSLAHYVALTPDSLLIVPICTRLCIPVIAIILAILEVSEIPMFSLKYKRGMQRDAIVYRLRKGFFGGCVASLIFVILIGAKFSLVILLSVTIYILINLIHALVRKIRGI